MPLEPRDSLFAVVAFFPRRLLALLAAVLLLVRVETVKLGLKCRQTLVLVLERSAKCLHFIVLVVCIYIGDS